MPLTNFEYLTKDKGTFAMFLDRSIARPYKCAYCVRMNAPFCPVGIKCFDHIMAWLVKPHEEKKS